MDYEIYAYQSAGYSKIAFVKSFLFQTLSLTAISVFLSFYVTPDFEKRADEICTDLNIDPSTRVSNLTNDEVAQIRKYIEANFRVEGDLRRDVSQNIRRKTEIGTYQGLRHRKGLPVRGQRTHTNARTRKGPRFAIAGKKKALK